MQPEELKQNITVYGPLFPEPVQVIMAIPMGSSVKLIGKGVRSSTVYEPILSPERGVSWAFHKSAAFTIGTNDALRNDRIISASAALAIWAALGRILDAKRSPVRTWTSTLN
jgi:hypothetical protein